MSNNVTCPNCHIETAYFNSSEYECPDCGYVWYTDSLKSSSLFSNDENTEYSSLIKQLAPYFKLDHGKHYNCTWILNSEIEEITIMPLAFEIGKNRQFILANSLDLLSKYPEDVRALIKMDFATIMNDGTADMPEEFGYLTNSCTTNAHNELLGFNADIYRDFKVIQ